MRIEIMVVVALYLLVILLVGLNAYRKTKTLDDYFAYGKRVGLWFLGFAAFSSIMSGFGFVGGPGLVYMSGSASLWITFAQSLAFPVAWIVLGKRVRLLAEVRNVLTVPDLVYARYNSNAARAWMAVALLVGVVAYMGAQILAAGSLMVSVFGVPLWVGLLIANGILLIYSVLGGMIAGIDTDFVQGLIMVVGSVAVFVFALASGGGMSQITMDIAAAAGPDMVGPWGTLPVLTALTWWFVFAVGNSGQPQLVHKLYTIRDVFVLRWAGLLAGLAYMLGSLLWMSVGFATRALVETGRLKPLENPDLAAPTFLLEYTPPILAGLVFAAVLGAIMSTADAFLLIGAGVVTRDLPEALGIRLRSPISAARWAIVIITVVSTLVAFYAELFVAVLGTVGWGLFAGAIVPALGIGLNWRRATSKAAIWSIVTSLVVNVGLELLNRFGIYKLPHGIVVTSFGLMVAVIVFIAVSLLTPKEEMAEDVAAVMEA